MASWLSMATALVGLAIAIVRWLDRRDSLEEAQVVQFAEMLQEQRKAVLNAKAIRNRVESDPAFREWVRQQVSTKSKPD